MGERGQRRSKTLKLEHLIRIRVQVVRKSSEKLKSTSNYQSQREPSAKPTHTQRCWFTKSNLISNIINCCTKAAATWNMSMIIVWFMQRRQKYLRVLWTFIPINVSSWEITWPENYKQGRNGKALIQAYDCWNKE